VKAPREPREYFDVTALAEHSGRSVRWIRDRIHDAHDPLPAYRIRRQLLVNRAEFEAWMARRCTGGAHVDAIVDDMLREFTSRPRESARLSTQRVECLAEPWGAPRIVNP
jgi:hypothetical protein